MTLALGEKAPNFDLPAVDGNSYTLDSFGDKDAVAVVFTCNHCPYVLAWEDRLIDIQRDYADRGLQLVGIGANDAEKYPSDNFENMKKHAAEKNFNFPYLRDESQEVARAYGAERTPEVFLFDGDGALRYHGTVDDNYDNPDSVNETYLRDAIDAVLSGESPSTANTKPVGCTIKWK